MAMLLYVKFLYHLLLLLQKQSKPKLNRNEYYRGFSPVTCLSISRYDSWKGFMYGCGLVFMTL